MHTARIRRANRSSIWWFIAWVAIATGASLQVHAADGIEDELPVALTVDGEPLASDFLVIERDGKLYVPLLNTASLLSFVVEAPTAALAHGHTGNPVDAFWIAAGRTDAVIDGFQSTIRADDAIIADGMLWVSDRLLGRLLPVTATLDTKNYVLRLTSTGELPRAAQRRREREHKALAKDAPAGDADARRAPFPYTALGLPSGDVQVLVNARDGGTDLDVRALLTGDLVYMNGALFLRGGDHGLDEARLRLTRESADGGVFGVDSMTRAEFGDVYATSMPLIGSAQSGRGFALSSFPLDQQTQFDATRIEGDAPPGWQVEVYGNGRLLAFQQVTSNGRYLFESLPVLFGENEYRLMFYGPGGQRREELRTVRVGADRIPAGEWRWRVAADQPGHSLFGVGDERRDGVATAASGEVRYGLLDWLTIGAFMARSPTSIEANAPLADYAGAVLRASLGGVAVNADVVAQDNGTVGADLAAIAQIAGTSVSARWSEYRGLQTPESTRGGEPLDREVFMRLNRALPSWLLRSADIGLELTRDEYASGLTESRFTPILRHQLGGVLLEHELEYRRTEFAGIGSDQWQLRSAATFHFGSAQLRAQLAARAGGVDGANLSGLWSLNPQTYLGFNYSHQMEDQDDDLSAYVARDFGLFTARLVAGHSDFQGAYGSLEISLSFAFDQRHRPIFSSRRLASGGLAEPFVYLDRDNDGNFDVGSDEPLAGVQIAVDRASRDDASDAGGEILLDSLPTLTRTVLAVDPHSLSDPFYESSRPALSFQGRPGTLFRAEFPVVETGFIQGHVYRAKGGGDVALPGVVLGLVDTSGRVVARAISQIDGYYVFERVVPGSWRVRVQSATTAASGVGMAAERRAQMTSANLQLDNLDFSL